MKINSKKILNSLKSFLEINKKLRKLNKKKKKNNEGKKGKNVLKMCEKLDFVPVCEYAKTRKKESSR